MKNYLCINGRQIELSRKSARNLEREFCKCDIIDEMIEALPDYYADCNQKDNIQHLGRGGFNEKVILPLHEFDTDWTLWVFKCAEILVSCCRAHCEIEDVYIKHRKGAYCTNPRIVVNIKR